MKRVLMRLLPLLIFTSVCSMPTPHDEDRGSEEDGILIDQALLRILEAEEELASAFEEIQVLQEQRDRDIPPVLSSEAVTQDPVDQPDLGEMPMGDQPMEDMMMGDMPIEGPVDDNEAQGIEVSPTPPILGGRPNDSITAERIIHEFASGEGRKKHMQKELIRARVLNYTRPLGNHSDNPARKQAGKITFPPTIYDILRMVQRQQEMSSGQLTGNQPKPAPQSSDGLSNSFTRRQSLFPSCEIPKNTDEEVWLPGENSFSMNLLFNFNQTNLAGNKSELLEATLRLYKIAQQTTPLISSCNLQNSNDNVSNFTTEIPTTLGPLPTSEGTETVGAPSDRKVRVTVYLLTRALKKTRVKRRRLESRLISLNNSEWTAWNVFVAAKLYLDNRRNFGLQVEVEDENQCFLPAHRIFKMINCSEEAATARPLPFPFINAFEEHVPSTIRGTYTFNENLFPIMDIRSLATRDTNPFFAGQPTDLPSTAPSHTADTEVTEQLTTRTSRSSTLTSSSLNVPVARRHRHGDNAGSGNHRRRRKPNNADQGDIQSMDFRSLIIPQRIVMTAAEQRRHLSNATPVPVTR